MAGLEERIRELLRQRLLDQAIQELKILERSKNDDNTNSVVLSAALERSRLRFRSGAISSDELERSNDDFIASVQTILSSFETGPQTSIQETTGRVPSQHETASTSPTVHGTSNVLLLVHGIRTHADWFEMVDQLMTTQVPCQVVTVRYGYMDLPQFLWPFGKEHSWPVQKVKSEIQSARRKYPNAKMTVIAHSFGTFALVNALADPTIEVDRILLCGSIVPEKWQFTKYLTLETESTSIVNDCSNQDVWPVLAKCLGWGFGASGSFGFGKTGIRDRSFSFKHSDFFEPSFVSQYWVPFVKNGSITAPPISTLTKPARVLSIISADWVSGLIRLGVWLGIFFAIILFLAGKRPFVA